MKKLPVLVVIFSLLLITCEMKDSGIHIIPVETQGNFWAQNISNSSFYGVDAELLYEGVRCNVWAEKGSGVTYDQAQSIAVEYDTKIYQKMIDAFGFTSVTIGGKPYTYNTMEYADALSKNPDGKLCILLLDIKDDYKAGVNESYVAGYFWAGDLLSVNNSNSRDMIYIDTDPGLKINTANAYTTLAHEMQHLMNFVSSVVYRSTKSGFYTYVTTMDTWVDEGLSSAAEYIYKGSHVDNRWTWYNNNGNGGSIKGLIDKGNNFFVWNNRGNESSYAVLDDYATVYLFFQWLRIQAGSTDIYKTIITSSNNDYRAVTNAINKAIPGQDYSSWDTLLKTWLAANHINAADGAYGYKGELSITAPAAPAAPGGNPSIMLYPGEGVYSKTSSTPPSFTGQGSNIGNVYLNSTQPQNDHASNIILLTYNKNTNNDKNVAGEQGTITGVASITAAMSRGGAAVEQPLSGPFPIGAGDLLGQKGATLIPDDLIFKTPANYNGIIVNE